MKVVFMGTPEFAVPTLMEIAGQGHEMAAVYTQPPRPAGRGMDERNSHVHNAADALGIEVRHPPSLKDRAEEVADLGADVIVVVAYGLILPQAVLDAAPMGAFNLHASLLPRWRGAAPVARAILAQDSHTGVCVMKMEAGLDTGPVAMEERVRIAPSDTAGELTEKLSRLGADLMVRALGALQRGGLNFRPQSEDGITYAHKIDKAEAQIDFTKPADAVRAQIHGMSPWPGAYALLEVAGKPERVKVLLAQTVSGNGVPGTLLDDRLTVACGEGALSLTRVQRPGKGVMSGEEFVRGVRVAAGARFI
ncbi:MAG: methionyl-tRNA formyltransferase [Pseudomonadota bacterium]